MSINDDHCIAIGRITVAYAELDTWLSSFIWTLIAPFEEQHLGQIITAELSFRQKLDLAAALFKYRCDDPVKRIELKALISRIEKLEARRNNVQHSLWIHQSEEPEQVTQLKITAKRKNGLTHTKKIITPQQLYLLSKELNEATSDLSSFHISFLP